MNPACKPFELRKLLCVRWSTEHWVDLDYVQGVNTLSTIQCMHSPRLHGGWLLWSSKASLWLGLVHILFGYLFVLVCIVAWSTTMGENTSLLQLQWTRRKRSKKTSWNLFFFCIVFIVLVVVFLNITRKMHLRLF